MTDARAIIARIRDGGAVPPDDLRWFAWDAPPAGLDASVAALMSSARLRMFR